LATPSVSFTAPATDIELCTGDPLLNTTAVTATIANNSASQYRLVWSLEIYTQSGDPMSADEWFNTSKVSIGNAQAYAVNKDQTSPQSVAAAGPVALTSITLPYIAIGGKTTVYTYTLTAINDVVSRRGDFIGLGAGVNATTPGSFKYYDVAGVNPIVTNDVVTITVHPTPSTGPIFHISNTWAN
jgi:hypothetical protein